MTIRQDFAPPTQQFLSYSGRNLADLLLASLDVPSAEAFAAWETALRRVIADIAGGPSWHRHVLARDASSALAGSIREHASIFPPAPLIFLRKGGRMDWRDLALIGRPVQRPEHVPVAAVFAPIWYADTLGLRKDTGSSGLMIATANLGDSVPFGYAPHFVHLNRVHAGEGKRSAWRERWEAAVARGAGNDEEEGEAAEATHADRALNDTLRFRLGLVARQIGQAETARLCGVNQSMISEWLSGKRNPGTRRLVECLRSLSRPETGHQLGKPAEALEIAR